MHYAGICQCILRLGSSLTLEEQFVHGKSELYLEINKSHTLWLHLEILFMKSFKQNQ